MDRIDSPRPRRGDRVPVDRRHPGRAQGTPAPARRRRARPSTRSSPSGPSVTCCSPGCSSARRSRTRRRSSSRWPSERVAACPAPRDSTSATSSWRPTRWPGSPPSGCGWRSCKPPCRGPSRASTSTTWLRSGRASPTRSSRSPTSSAGWARSASAPSPRRLAYATRGGGAVPRGARALQAGPRRARAGHDVRRHRDRLADRRIGRRRVVGRRVGRSSTPTTADVLPTDTRRALEAVLMVAEEPVEPQLLAQLLEVSVEAVLDLCTELAAQYAIDERGFELVRGGRRLPLPEPPGPGAVRRAVRRSTGRPPACRRPRSRRWPSWPTSNRSPGHRSPPSAA